MSDFNVNPGEGRLVLTGTFVFHDAAGNVVGKTVITAPVPKEILNAELCERDESSGT